MHDKIITVSNYGEAINMYADRFWKKNWDQGVEDLGQEEYETTYVKIVDRTKDMIIVGGFKVFSSKVEDVLAQHPAVALLALIGENNPDRPGSELVKAYIQLTPEAAIQSDKKDLKNDIISFAKKNCAPYEVPKSIEFMDEIPLTAVGKIDKKVLRKK
jgi:long-chain acyl-CoA synthetase